MKTEEIEFALSNIRTAIKLLNKNEIDVSKIRNQLLSAEHHMNVLDSEIGFGE